MLTQMALSRAVLFPWGQLEIYMCTFACHGDYRITFNYQAERGKLNIL